MQLRKSRKKVALLKSTLLYSTNENDIAFKRKKNLLLSHCKALQTLCKTQFAPVASTQGRERKKKRKPTTNTTTIAISALTDKYKKLLDRFRQIDCLWKEDFLCALKKFCVQVSFLFPLCHFQLLAK